MRKREGHSHTEFCPHGSGDDVELMIQKAIKLGFQEYSITEHAPLPPAFKTMYAGQPTGLTEASMAMGDLEAYFAKANRMKAKYAQQIHIHIGFEVDFIPILRIGRGHFLTSMVLKPMTGFCPCTL